MNERMNDELKGLLQRIEQSFMMVEERISRLREQKVELEVQLRDATAKVEHLEKTCGEHDRYRTEVQARLTQLDDEKAILLSRLAESHASQEESEQSLQNVSNDNAILNERIRELEARLERSASELQETGALQSELDRSRSELERQKENYRLQIEEMERRVQESEQTRASSVEEIDRLTNERDQARSTVESMLVRVRQLEANEQRNREDLKTRSDSMSRDLDEALEMAAHWELECTKNTAAIGELQKELLAARSTSSLADEDRQDLIIEVERALDLIDRHISPTTNDGQSSA